MPDTLEHALCRFRDLVNAHPRMKTLLKGWDRAAVVATEDADETFTVEFKDCQIVRVAAGIQVDNAAIKLKATQRTLTDIFLGDLNPASEFLDGRLQVIASDKDQVKLDAITLLLWD
ncbi:MAG TPA: SCP2 sterol-binding domain-containing protein [Kofleriaceae bacterium]|nr:SCP2 sterol-binding domain-containing protein [Kofleriaceae bacterium]